MEKILFCEKNKNKNLILRKNPDNEYPSVHESSYIDPAAIIIGKVTIGKNVYIGPNAVIRADEFESSIVIEDNCNIQDSVIIHALKKTEVFVGAYSSLSHGCVVHGPCTIGEKCFVGFNSVVFNSFLEKNVFVKHLTVIENVTVPSNSVVLSGSNICSQDDIQKLNTMDENNLKFSENVVKTNIELVKGYKRI